MQHTRRAIEGLIEDYAPWRMAERVKGLLLPSMRLRATPAASDAGLPLGCSKAGGWPDLPSCMDWPVLPTLRPLDFLLQVDLADLPDQRAEASLPRRGLLSFFSPGLGLDFPASADPRETRVFYDEGEGARLCRMSPPLGGEPSFAPCALTCALEWSLPVEREPWFRLLDLPWPWDPRLPPPEEVKRYDALLSRLAEVYGWDMEPVHRLFGYPDPIAGDGGGGSMQVQCHRAFALSSTLIDWRLLLQLDADDRFGRLAQRMGRLFFWIRQDDLVARRFNRVLLIRQAV